MLSSSLRFTNIWLAAFKFLGGVLMVLGVLATFSAGLTLLIQILAPGFSPDMSLFITAFAGLMSALLTYLGWRIVKAKRSELMPFNS